jgi:hypothetical protein
MSQLVSSAMLPGVLGEPDDGDTWRARFSDWARTELVWYAGSFTIHLLGLSTLLLLGNVAIKTMLSDEPPIECAMNEPPPPELPPVEITPPQTEPIVDPRDAAPSPAEAIPETPTALPPGGGTGEDNADPGGVLDSLGNGRGGGTGDLGGPPIFINKPGSRVSGSGGNHHGIAGWPSHGHGGTGFGPRGSGRGPGETPDTENAVLRALNWLARHQSPDGSWSLKQYVHQCKDATCSGTGSVEADAAATAMGLLPFLAHGETHKTGAHYRLVANGLLWLVRHQKPDGDLSAGSEQQMYTHALATIALCEAYGMSGDRNIGVAAQAAIQFIETAQNKQTGGWRYHPGDEGDTSVVGWQIMALKSAQMAGLNVGGSSLEWAGKFLDSVKKNSAGSQFAYQPGQEATPAMTSVGLLCRQYLGANRNDPLVTDGAEYLLHHAPEAGLHNLYYWYYATQVMHNVDGPQFDTWNRKMRHILTATQDRDAKGCARGSWDPNGPAKDQWGEQGGRLMMTSLSALTLEVYYRYLPLYTMDGHRQQPGTKTAEPKLDSL